MNWSVRVCVGSRAIRLLTPKASNVHLCMRFVRNLFGNDGSMSLAADLKQCLKLQTISHFLLSLPSHTCFHRQPTSFEKLCLGDEPVWKSFSSSYGILLAVASQHDPPYLRKWEKNLNTTFSEDQNNRLLLFAHKSSLCSKYQEITFKILTC